MFCKNCGNEIPEGAKFCVNCGTPVEVPSEPAPEAPSTPVYEEPAAPVIEKPAPVAEEPAPTYEEPTPVYEEPTPVQAVPQQPVYQQPVYQQPAPQQPTYQQPVYQQPVYQAAATVVSSVTSTNVLVWGILGLAFSCSFYLSLLGLIFSIVAKGKVTAYTTGGGQLTGKAKVGAILAKVGLILGIVFTALFFLWLIIVIVAAIGSR